MADLLKKAIDDRGNPIRSVNPRDLAGVSPVFLKHLKKAMRREGGSSRRGQLVSAGLSGAFLIGWLTLSRQSVVPSAFGVPLLIAMIVLLAVVSRIVASRLGRAIRHGGFARAIAARGYCGGCGYDLRASDPDAEGYVRCPECNAQWTQARLHSAVELPADAWNPLGDGRGRVERRTKMTIDHRGAIIRRIRSLPIRLPRRVRKQLTKEHRAAIRLARRRCGLWWRLLISSLGLALLAFGLYVSRLDSGPTWSSDEMAILAVVMSVPLLLTWITEAGVNARKFLQLISDAGVCGACASPFDRDETDADGFCVCRNCGSSWRTTASRTEA